MLPMRHVRVLVPILFLPTLAIARPPVPYGGWNVSNGIVDTNASCSAANVSCKTIASDNGFQYEEVSVLLSTQERYNFLRLVVTDPNATGTPDVGTTRGTLAFATETFTPFAVGGLTGTNLLPGSGIVQGIASKQTIHDSADNFSVDAEIQKGNMRTLNATSVDDMFSTKIEQSMGTTEMSSNFSFTNYTSFATLFPTNQFPITSPDTTREIGRRLDINEQIAIGEPGDTTKNQRFVQSQRAGVSGTVDNPYYVQNSGRPFGLPTAFLYPANSGGSYYAIGQISSGDSMTLPVTQNGGQTGATNTVAWQAGDDVTVKWIAQNENAFGVPGVRSNLIALNYESITNNTTARAATASAAVVDMPAPADPFSWSAANFGTAPRLQ